MKRWLISSRSAPAQPDWDVLYAEHLPRIYQFFCYRVGEGATAEDLTATTFEKAWRARDRYRDDLAAFTTWLFAIARNVAKDYYRQHREHAQLEETHAAGDAPLDDDVQQKQDFARLLRLLAQLPERDRDVLALKFGAALNHRDIARIMTLSESNVAVIAHRAVQHLRAQWPAQGDEHGQPE